MMTRSRPTVRKWLLLVALTVSLFIPHVPPVVEAAATIRPPCTEMITASRTSLREYRGGGFCGRICAGRG